jgi:hypothetical protein
MENGSTGLGADQRCEGTTWNASPACTYSTMRATVASNCSRVTLDSNTGAARRAPTSASGTGPARRSRTSPMRSEARA